MELPEIFALHRTLSPECAEDVMAVAVLHEVPKRTVVLGQGETCRNFYFNRSGLMRVAHVEDGVEDTICFGACGDVFTSLASYHLGLPSYFSLISICDSEVWTISYDDMHRLMERHVDLVWWMKNLLVEQVWGFERRYIFFGNRDAEQRYMNFISKRNGMLRHVPVKYIAQYLKIAPEYLSRIRRKLVKK